MRHLVIPAETQPSSEFERLISRVCGLPSVSTVTALLELIFSTG
jgi:hypothetical protein